MPELFPVTDYKPLSPPGAVKLRALIAETGLPAWQVAQQIGSISPAQLSHFLTRRRKPTPHQVMAMAEYFKVDPSELVG